MSVVPLLDSPSAVGDEGRPRATSLAVVSAVLAALVTAVGYRVGQPDLLLSLGPFAGLAAAGPEAPGRRRPAPRTAPATEAGRAGRRGSRPPSRARPARPRRWRGSSPGVVPRRRPPTASRAAGRRSPATTSDRAPGARGGGFPGVDQVRGLEDDRERRAAAPVDASGAGRLDARQSRPAPELGVLAADRVLGDGVGRDDGDGHVGGQPRLDGLDRRVVEQGRREDDLCARRERS